MLIHKARDGNAREHGRINTLDGSDTRPLWRRRPQRRVGFSKAALLCAVLLVLATHASPAQVTNPVVQWNRTLLAIVRTHGAQPASIHPTRSFALLHSAIYDAVNAIDRTHNPYVVGLNRVPPASQESAAAAAAHEVLLQLYPAFQPTLDAQLQQELAQIPDGAGKTDGVSIGTGVPISSWLCEAMTTRPPSPRRFFSAALREITSQRRQISQPSLNSLNGLE